MISEVDEIRRLLGSSEESYYTDLSRTIYAFAAGFTAAFVVAVLVSCIIRSLRRYFNESQRHSSTASAVSPPGQRRRDETVVLIPAHIYDAGQSSARAAATSYELQICAICLGEFEKGDCVSVLPRCKHMFHNDCIKQWMPVKSVNCPICRVPVVERDAAPARIAGRVAGRIGVQNPSLSALLALSLSSSGMTISSNPGRGL